MENKSKTAVLINSCVFFISEYRRLPPRNAQVLTPLFYVFILGAVRYRRRLPLKQSINVKKMASKSERSYSCWTIFINRKKLQFCLYFLLVKHIKSQKNRHCTFNDDDAEQDTRLADLYVRADLNCASQIELAYYSAGYEQLCIHCGTEENLFKKEGHYPQCHMCTAKPVTKRGRNLV